LDNTQSKPNISVTTTCKPRCKTYCVLSSIDGNYNPIDSLEETQITKTTSKQTFKGKLLTENYFDVLKF